MSGTIRDFVSQGPVEPVRPVFQSVKRPHHFLFTATCRPWPRRKPTVIITRQTMTRASMGRYRVSMLGKREQSRRGSFCRASSGESFVPSASLAMGAPSGEQERGGGACRGVATVAPGLRCNDCARSWSPLPCDPSHAPAPDPAVPAIFSSRPPPPLPPQPPAAVFVFVVVPQLTPPHPTPHHLAGTRCPSRSGAPGATATSSVVRGSTPRRRRSECTTRPSCGSSQ